MDCCVTLPRFPLPDIPSIAVDAWLIIAILLEICFFFASVRILFTSKWGDFAILAMSGCTDGVRAHPARSMIGVLTVCRPPEFLIVRNYSPDFERRLKISRELFRIVALFILFIIALLAVSMVVVVTSQAWEGLMRGGTGSAAYLQLWVDTGNNSYCSKVSFKVE